MGDSSKRHMIKGVSAIPPGQRSCKLMQLAHKHWGHASHSETPEWEIL